MPFFKFSLAGLVSIFGWALLTVAGVSSCTPASSEVDVPDSNSQAPTMTPSLTEEIPRQNDQLAQLQGQILPVTAEVQLGEQTIGLEVAETRQQQAIGLMHRESLPSDRGMLFPFSPARPVSFWMKNVQIPLDMVFVHNNQVVAIAENAPPCEADPCPTYGPSQQIVDYVIELRGGLASDLGLQVGDPITIEWLNKSQRDLEQGAATLPAPSFFS